MIGRYGASVGQIHRGKSGAYNVALIKTLPDSNRMSKEFFYYYLRSPMFQNALMKVAARSAQAGFSKADIYNFSVPTPSLDIQEEISNSCSSMEERTVALSETYNGKRTAFTALKQSILHRAFTGELAGERNDADLCLREAGS